jgi:hypothetical protein
LINIEFIFWHAICNTSIKIGLVFTVFTVFTVFALGFALGFAIAACNSGKRMVTTSIVISL